MFRVVISAKIWHPFTHLALDAISFTLQHSEVVLVDWTFDLKVSGSRPGPYHCVVSLEKKLYLAMTLSNQVYKMGTGDILLGVILRWTSIPSRGISNTPSCFTLQKPG